VNFRFPLLSGGHSSKNLHDEKLGIRCPSPLSYLRRNGPKIVEFGIRSPNHCSRLSDDAADDVSDHCKLSSFVPEPTLLQVSSASSLPPILEALILALKFSPRETGCCEHALGQALDSHLWAGKKAPTSKEVITGSAASSILLGASRAVVPTQNESSYHAQHFVKAQNLLFLYSRLSCSPSFGYF
jgi:hypothetical protein